MSKYDELSRTKYCAFLCLGRKSYTKHELYKKLIGKNYSEECCRETIEYLESEGYLDDRDYAEKFVHDSIEFKKHGIRLIKTNLRQKGIDEEIIDSVLCELEENDEDTITKVIKKRAEKLDLNDKKQKDRLIGYLLRRGFSYGEIFSALRKFTDDDNFEGDF